MPDLKQLSTQETSLSTISDFFSAYQKLTIYQMQKNRNSIINSRKFFKGLLDTFVDLKQDLKKMLIKNNNKISFSTLEKNGKTVSVFISFETKFSTHATRQALKFFASEVKKIDTDIVITGVNAKKLFKEFFPKNQEYTYFDLTENNLDLKSNLPIMKHILRYEQVDIYHPFFVSIMKQTAQKNSISGDISIVESNNNKQDKNKHFLIEPSKKRILHFFEIQIMSSLFQHKIKEAHLANLGARISTLQNTQDNLEQKLKKIRNMKLKTLKYTANKKQRNRLSGMRFWIK